MVPRATLENEVQARSYLAPEKPARRFCGAPWKPPRGVSTLAIKRRSAARYLAILLLLGGQSFRPCRLIFIYLPFRLFSIRSLFLPLRDGFQKFQIDPVD